MRKLLALILSFGLAGCSSLPMYNKPIEAADGHTYMLAKPEKQLGNGLAEAALYIRVGVRDPDENFYYLKMLDSGIGKPLMTRTVWLVK